MTILSGIYTTRICRYQTCYSISKIITSTFSARPAQKPATAAATATAGTQEPRYLTIPEKSGSQYIVVPNPVVPFPSLAPDTSKDDRTVSKVIVDADTKRTVRKEPEWREVKLEPTKLHKYCLMLSKIRLTSLVVITTMGGYALAPAPFDPYTFLMCSVGTGLVSATANAVNQYFEVPFDAQMSRTKNRVLVRGYVTPAHAITFAILSGTVGLSILYHQVNGLTAALGATNLILYTLIYTPMKRISILNTWIGSIVGAIPPLMGWAGCTGDILSPGAWIMSGMLYAWQFPHFNALSWNLRPDYSRAGYRMMSVTNPDLCRKTALRYTAVLLGLSYLAPALDVTHWWFAALSTPLNGYFLYLAWRFNKQSDSASSRKLFRFSLIHLPALMLLMLCSKKYWAHEKGNTDSKGIGDLQGEGVLSAFKRLSMSETTTI